MLNDALPRSSKETDLDAVAKNTVEKRLANKQLIPGIGHGIHTGGDPRADKLFQVAQQTKVYGRYCELLGKIGKIADEKVGKHLPINVTGAIAAISMDMGFHWQMSKSFAILGRALGGLAHVGEEIRRPIARGISNLIRDNLQYERERRQPLAIVLSSVSRVNLEKETNGNGTDALQTQGDDRCLVYFLWTLTGSGAAR
jgi:citrate synthase